MGRRYQFAFGLKNPPLVCGKTKGGLRIALLVGNDELEVQAFSAFHFALFVCGVALSETRFGMGRSINIFCANGGIAWT